MDYKSIRQEKRENAKRKVHKGPSKRAQEFTSSKQVIIKNRKREREEKRYEVNSTRSYFCSTCFRRHDDTVCKCGYLQWCGSKDGYNTCKWGMSDLCDYHASDFFYVTSSMYDKYDYG